VLEPSARAVLAPPGAALLSSSSHPLGWLRSRPHPPTFILQEAGRGCPCQATTCFSMVEHERGRVNRHPAVLEEG